MGALSSTGGTAYHTRGRRMAWSRALRRALRRPRYEIRPRECPARNYPSFKRSGVNMPRNSSFARSLHRPTCGIRLASALVVHFRIYNCLCHASLKEQLVKRTASVEDSVPLFKLSWLHG